jgi:hypothetical protein
MTDRSSLPSFMAAAVVFAAFMSMPTVAHAQDNVTKTKQVTQDVFFQDDSICTGDHVEGSAHQVFTEETTTSPTRTKFKTSNNENGKGTGTPSFAQYQFQDFASHEVITTAKNMTDILEERKHLIRTSGGQLPANLKDDEFLRQFTKTTVTNNEPTVTVEKTQMECK